jgi:hypothetical protein
VHYNDTLPFLGWVSFTRLELAKLFCELGFTQGAEIGVERGRFSNVLLGNNPNLHLKCIEPWKAFTHHSDATMEETFQNCKARLARYGDRVEYIRKTSLDAVKDIPDASLDFVYIDAMHDFDNCIQDIINWVPKVRSGGIVSGHDYIKIYQYGVMDAVNAYTRVHNIGMWYITSERDPRKDGSPSWFWVRGS